MLEEQEAQKHFKALEKAQKKKNFSEDDIKKMVVKQED